MFLSDKTYETDKQRYSQQARCSTGLVKEMTASREAPVLPAAGGLWSARSPGGAGAELHVTAANSSCEQCCGLRGGHA